MHPFLKKFFLLFFVLHICIAHCDALGCSLLQLMSLITFEHFKCFIQRDQLTEFDRRALNRQKPNALIALIPGNLY